MNSIMPFTCNNLEILVHALVSFRETQNESDFKDPNFKVVPLVLKELTIIHPVNVVMGEVYTHLFIEGIYTT